jgi:hypothetical protein
LFCSTGGALMHHHHPTNHPSSSSAFRPAHPKANTEGRQPEKKRPGNAHI